ncbi:MAG: pyruvate ferredoxin oxidoreductase [Deltaproteobacteria bacterium]|nr:pyruvate ferredoxin oxidoreductase [Deltaproteobacteria bacterium]MBM4324153.1 pyruvate ferredoxin oxidoreductase [Deltaproteobacteria bacterium]
MIEIRIHGRGGQGTVVASKVMASAFFKQGRWVQAFPSFGAERRGAPVAAYTRVDEKEITLRCSVRHPDHLIILDQNLAKNPEIIQGLKEGGWIVINSEKGPKDFSFPPRFHVATIDASGIAIRHGLGSKGSPIVSTVILGAFAKVTGLLKITDVLEAIRENVPAHIRENRAGAKEAYQKVRAVRFA